ncbi:chemotaxis protein CheW [Allohahella marinimesophila]|uniref:CheW-like domain-containing protein n=1 Tax=Allohahella marinimesophila TaxID=1054972 RepID=A0ABP7NJ15_9GAMM
MSRQHRDAELMDYLADLLTVEPEAPEADAPAPVLPDRTPVQATSEKAESLPAVHVSSDKPSVDYAGLPSAFDSLLFRVGPFKLALPLLGISSVHNYGDALHELPGMVSWILGVVQMPRERLCVVDMLSLFSGSAGHQRAAVPEPIQRLVVLYGSRWALACHEIIEVRQLKRADIRWRKPGASSSRSWCIGTLASDLCILVDPKQLHRYLDQLLQSSAGNGHTD